MLGSDSLYVKMVNTWKEYSDFKIIECNTRHTQFSFNDYLLEIENVSKDSGLNINIGYGYYARNTLCMVRNDREVESANALILDIAELLTGKKKPNIYKIARVAYYKGLARTDFEPYEDSEGRLTNQIINSMNTELIKLLDSDGVELPDYMMLIQKRIDELLRKHTYNEYSQYVVSEISSRRKKNITDKKLIQDLTNNYLWLIASFGFGEKSLNNNFMRSTLINLQEYNSRNISYYKFKKEINMSGANISNSWHKHYVSGGNKKSGPNDFIDFYYRNNGAKVIVQYTDFRHNKAVAYAAYGASGKSLGCYSRLYEAQRVIDLGK